MGRPTGDERRSTAWEDAVRNRTRFVTISAVVSLVYGAAVLIAPAVLTSLYGVGLDRAGRFLVQFLGASYIGYAIIGWRTRASADPAARGGVALG